jgi:phage gp36-like protein
MAYVTNAEIEARLGTPAYVQLTDDAGAGVADVGKVNEARLGAEGEADSYLARRVAVPVDLDRFPELRAVLKSFVLDLAEYRLHSRRPPVPADVVRRRGEAVQWLERVAKGEVVLPTTVEPEVNPATGVSGAAQGPARVWSRETSVRL